MHAWWRWVQRLYGGYCSWVGCLNEAHVMTLTPRSDSPPTNRSQRSLCDSLEVGEGRLGAHIRLAGTTRFCMDVNGWVNSINASLSLACEE
jgi:hypothetical protein